MRVLYRIIIQIEGVGTCERGRSFLLEKSMIAIGYILFTGAEKLGEYTHVQQLVPQWFII